MPQKITYGAILAVFVYFNALSFTYRGETALFPRVVLTISIILCILKLLALFSPKIAEMVDSQGLLEGSGRNMAAVKNNKIDEDALEDGIFKEESEMVAHEIIAGSRQRLKRELVVSSWAFLFFLAIWLLGFYIASGIMVFTFIKLIGNRSWLNSLLISGLTPVLIYAVFRVALKIPLYTGVFF